MNDKELRRLVKEVAEKTKGNIVVADFAVAVARKAVLQAKEQILKQHAPKPRELAPCGTGALLGEQQFCFEKGWKEGIAAFRKLIRSNV